MRHKSSHWVLLAIVCVVGLPACSTIKSYFPDKTKDYQLETELPPLALPDDIKPEAKIKDQPILPEPVYSRESSGTVQTEIAKNKPDEAKKTLYSPVELIEYDAGATRLRIYQPIDKAWRFVGKALSRQAIEITQRDRQGYSYTVQYDSHARKVEDGTLWDELMFFIGNEPSQEKQYYIQLSPRNSELTDVVVLDDQKQPVRQGDGLKLLKLLKTTINNDLAHHTR